MLYFKKQYIQFYYNINLINTKKKLFKLYVKIYNTIIRLISILALSKRKKFRTSHLIIPYECIKLPNIEKYNKDKEELLKNLNEEAKNNCLKILNG